MTGTPSSDISASTLESPKNLHVRVSTVLISSSKSHCKFTVDPGLTTEFFGCAFSFPIEDKIYTWSKISDTAEH
jgi:hypothetical protein